MNEPVPFMLNITEEAREIGSAKAKPERETWLQEQRTKPTTNQSILHRKGSWTKDASEVRPVDDLLLSQA